MPPDNADEIALGYCICFC